MTLAATLAEGTVLHMPASVVHSRRGPVRHAFRYGVDYLLFSPQALRPLPFFSRNHFNLFSFHDRDSGGARGAGEGETWARRKLEEAGLPMAGLTLALLTQPRFLGRWFTPVSFWLAFRGDDLIAAIAEVNNTFGQRHSYLCHHGDFRAIAPSDMLEAQKVFHVSPFQDVSGRYAFSFRFTPERIAIRIFLSDGANGLDAAMAGKIKPANSLALIGAALRRPGGSMRVLFLIYWNALRLKLKGVAYRALPLPPDQEISR